MATAQSVSMQSSDPGRNGDTGSVTKSVSIKGVNDNLTVDAFEDGMNGRNAQVVLKVSSDGRATASVDANNNPYITGNGGSSVQYLLVNLNSSDPDNWTINVGTSGGSTYVFKKGKGGGGHS